MAVSRELKALAAIERQYGKVSQKALPVMKAALAADITPEELAPIKRALVHFGPLSSGAKRLAIQNCPPPNSAPSASAQEETP